MKGQKKMLTNVYYHGVKPLQASPGAAGLDLACNSYRSNIIIVPGATAIVPTGTFIEIPEGYVGLVCPRSGLAYREGVTILNAPGIIDSDYRGEIKVLLHNTGRMAYVVKHEDRIAQLVITSALVPRLVEEQPVEFSKTQRGDKGFGSTGR
jgi:dUTP pyrophosphatase